MFQYTTSLKRCTKCGEEKPATHEYFGNSKKYTDGLNIYCRTCRNNVAKEYRANNPEKTRASSKTSKNKRSDYYREFDRARYYANREEKCKQQRARYARNAEDQREKAKIRAAKNRNQRRLNEQRRESLKHSVEFNFTLEHQRLALDYFHGCCAVCGHQLHDLFNTHRLEWDHWIPISKGGNTTPGNMLPLCGGRGGCNSLKHNIDPNEWLNRNFKPAQVKAILLRINTFFEWIKAQDSDL